MNYSVACFLKIATVLTIQLGFTPDLRASEYIIKFEEGAYQFDQTKKFDSLDNKYLSRVTIKINGKLQNENAIRGSTLPDSATFYNLWHASGKVASPTDDDVYKLYEDARKSKDNITSLKDAAIIPEDFLDFMYEWVTYVPVLYSGAYKFSIGLHQEGNSVHGKPYVPRIMGTDSDHPFEGKTGYTDVNWRYKVKVGGFIKTITYNKMTMGFKADGINIHDGRKTGSNRDSSGCLTIHPDHWQSFIGLFPDIETWSKEKHEGYVVIIRQGEADLECQISAFCIPTNLSIPTNLYIKDQP